MKISFDLDDITIPGKKTFETETQTFVQRLFGIEKIRKGMIELFKELKSRKPSVGIFTTSFRSTTRIKLTFLLNGFSVDFVVNQKRHTEGLGDRQNRPSKYPTIFGIDNYIDDSKGVEMEGEKYNFKTIIIDEKQPNWTTRFLKD